MPSCTGPTGPGPAPKPGALPVYCAHPPCADTLSGWVPVGPDQGNTPYAESHFAEVKALDRTLFARNSHGDVYFRPMDGSWRKLDLGEKAGAKEAMFVEGNILYLVTTSGRIYSVDALGNTTFLEKVPDSLTCQLPGASQCQVRDIYRYRGRFLIEAVQPYLDSAMFRIFRDSLYNYHLLLGADGAWSRMRWPDGDRAPMNLTFRNLWLHGDTIWGATFEDGIWVYDGDHWDSILRPKVPMFSQGQVIDSHSLSKWGGVAVFQGEVYAGPWAAGLYRLEGGELRKITFKAITSQNDTIEHDGLFNYGLDTLCGHLINVNGIERWKPGMLGWTRVVDTTQAYAVRGYYYPVASAFSMARIGDSLFAAHQAPLLGKQDSIPGGIAMLNLRDSPWCEETWRRGQAERAAAPP